MPEAIPKNHSPSDEAGLWFQNRGLFSDHFLKAQAAIASCDVFVLLLGDYTCQAQGVRREVKMAKQLGKRTFQLRKRCHSPIPVEGAGEVVAWKWKNLKKWLAQ